MGYVFDLLSAEEIECRVGTVKAPADGQEGGISLLLYKDARCDMARLDKTVGAMNWQRSHSRDNANCTVSIWDDDKKCWVSKEDTGVASKTEAEKGLASDSFKRACFNWGIGRELYTAPYIWISGNPNILKWDRYKVKKIAYDENRCIKVLVIINKKKKVVFQMGKIEDEEPDTPDVPLEQQKQPQKLPESNATVQEESKLPEKKVSPVLQFLATSRKGLCEVRGITIEENNKLFEEQLAALKEAGKAPKKKLSQYTMDEAQALIEAMYKDFTPTGTELKVG